MTKHAIKLMLGVFLFLGGLNEASAYGPYLVYYGEIKEFQVIDENNVNLPDVLVEFDVNSTANMYQSFVSASGAFAIVGAPVGTYTCRVSKPGYSSETFVVEFMEPVGRSASSPVERIRLVRNGTSLTSFSSPAKKVTIDALLAVSEENGMLNLLPQVHAGMSLLVGTLSEAVLPEERKLVA